MPAPRGIMLNNGHVNTEPALRYEDMDELQKAKADLDYMRRKGNHFGYKQAKAHYEKVLRRYRRERARR